MALFPKRLILSLCAVLLYLVLAEQFSTGRRVPGMVFCKLMSLSLCLYTEPSHCSRLAFYCHAALLNTWNAVGLFLPFLNCFPLLFCVWFGVFVLFRDSVNNSKMIIEVITSQKGYIHYKSAFVLAFLLLLAGGPTAQSVCSVTYALPVSWGLTEIRCWCVSYLLCHSDGMLLNTDPQGWTSQKKTLRIAKSNWFPGQWV